MGRLRHGHLRRARHALDRAAGQRAGRPDVPGPDLRHPGRRGERDRERDRRRRHRHLPDPPVGDSGRSRDHARARHAGGRRRRHRDRDAERRRDRRGRLVLGRGRGGERRRRAADRDLHGDRLGADRASRLGGAGSGVRARQRAAPPLGARAAGRQRDVVHPLRRARRDHPEDARALLVGRVAAWLLPPGHAGPVRRRPEHVRRDLRVHGKLHVAHRRLRPAGRGRGRPPGSRLRVLQHDPALQRVARRARVLAGRSRRGRARLRGRPARRPRGRGALLGASRGDARSCRRRRGRDGSPRRLRVDRRQRGLGHPRRLRRRAARERIRASRVPRCASARRRRGQRGQRERLPDPARAARRQGDGGQSARRCCHPRESSTR